MNTRSSLLISAALGLLACTDSSLQVSSPDAPSDDRLTVHVIEALGGG